MVAPSGGSVGGGGGAGPIGGGGSSPVITAHEKDPEKTKDKTDQTALEKFNKYSNWFGWGSALAGTSGAIITAGIGATAATTALGISAIGLLGVAMVGMIFLTIKYQTQSEQDVDKFTKEFKNAEKKGYDAFIKEHRQLPQIAGYEPTNDLKQIYQHAAAEKTLGQLKAKGKDSVSGPDWKALIDKMDANQKRLLEEALRAKLLEIVERGDYSNKDPNHDIDVDWANDASIDAWDVLFGESAGKPNLDEKEFNEVMDHLIDHEKTAAEHGFEHLKSKIEGMDDDTKIQEALFKKTSL